MPAMSAMASGSEATCLTTFRHAILRPSASPSFDGDGGTAAAEGVGEGSPMEERSPMRTLRAGCGSALSALPATGGAASLRVGAGRFCLTAESNPMGFFAPDLEEGRLAQAKYDDGTTRNNFLAPFAEHVKRIVRTLDLEVLDCNGPLRWDSQHGVSGDIIVVWSSIIFRLIKKLQRIRMRTGVRSRTSSETNS